MEAVTAFVFTKQIHNFNILINCLLSLGLVFMSAQESYIIMPLSFPIHGVGNKVNIYLSY